jgi:1-deoxy-D-xylulose-5-phosphate synthase
MRFVKPLDAELIVKLAHDHEALVTVEENVVAGGAGSGVAELLAEKGITVPLFHLGLPDRFIDHGDPALLLAQAGLDAKGIAASITAHFGPHFGQHRAEPRVKPAA